RLGARGLEARDERVAGQGDGRVVTKVEIDVPIARGLHFEPCAFRADDDLVLHAPEARSPSDGGGDHALPDFTEAQRLDRHGRLPRAEREAALGEDVSNRDPLRLGESQRLRCCDEGARRDEEVGVRGCRDERRIDEPLGGADSLGIDASVRERVADVPERSAPDLPGVVKELGIDIARPAQVVVEVAKRDLIERRAAVLPERGIAYEGAREPVGERLVQGERVEEPRIEEVLSEPRRLMDDRMRVLVADHVGLETEVDVESRPEDEDSRARAVGIDRVVVRVRAREEAEAILGVRDGGKGPVEPIEAELAEPRVELGGVVVDRRLGEVAAAACAEDDSTLGHRTAQSEAEGRKPGEGIGVEPTKRADELAAQRCLLTVEVRERDARRSSVRRALGEEIGARDRAAVDASKDARETDHLAALGIDERAIRDPSDVEPKVVDEAVRLRVAENREPASPRGVLGKKTSACKPRVRRRHRASLVDAYTVSGPHALREARDRSRDAPLSIEDDARSRAEDGRALVNLLEPNDREIGERVSARGDDTTFTRRRAEERTLALDEGARDRRRTARARVVLRERLIRCRRRRRLGGRRSTPAEPAHDDGPIDAGKDLD